MEGKGSGIKEREKGRRRGGEAKGGKCRGKGEESRPPSKQKFSIRPCIYLLIPYAFIYLLINSFFHLFVDLFCIQSSC